MAFLPHLDCVLLMVLTNQTTIFARDSPWLTSWATVFFISI